MRRVLVETYLRSLRKDDDGTDGIYRCLEFCMFETDCWVRAGVSVRLGPIAEQIICGSLSPDMSRLNHIYQSRLCLNRLNAICGETLMRVKTHVMIYRVRS